MCCGLGCDGCQVSAMRGEGGGICTTWNRNYRVCVMLTLDSNCALVNTNEIERFSCVFRWRIQLTRQSRWEIMSYPPQQNLQKCFLPLTKQKRDLVSFGCGCQDIMSPTNSLTLSCNQNQGRQKMGAWRSTTFTLVQFRLSPTLSSYWLFLTRHFCYNRENKSQKKKGTAGYRYQITGTCIVIGSNDTCQLWQTNHTITAAGGQDWWWGEGQSTDVTAQLVSK